MSVGISQGFGIGRLDSIFFGPMYSGKTTKLLQRLTTCVDIGLNVLYVNHCDDNRETTASSSNVTTHHSQFTKTSDKMATIKTDRLIDLDVSPYDIIGVDEGQFFDDIPEAVRKWVLQDKKQVFISSLDGDANMKPFGRVNELICLCSPKGLYKLEAKCHRCLQQNTEQLTLVSAGFTYKINGNSTETNQKDIGGVDKYIAVCLKCHQELKAQSQQ